MSRLAALAVLLILVACASPEEQCLRRAVPDTAALDREIAETEASIARGYRLDQGANVTVGLNLCQATGNVSLCLGGAREIPPKPVPIDRAVERQHLAHLKARRAEIVAASQRAMAACRAGS
jgi:hypothetical protein